MEMNTYKEKLLAEKNKLEAELGTVGRKNKNNPNDWEPTPEEMNVSNADRNEAADAIEEFETRAAVEVELEKRLAEVTLALEKIEDGKYGVCVVGGEMIEEDRLAVNPAAATCKLHMN